MIRLWCNGPKELDEFDDYTFEHHFGREIPSCIPRTAMYEYFVGRANQGDIRKFIRFRTVVRHVDFDEESKEFLVVVDDLLVSKPLEHLKFVHVIVATGHFTTPNIPDFEGVSQFPGRVLHAHDFRGADEFVNQRLLLVGGSLSAEDIALQCHKFGAKSITISYRTRALDYRWPDNIKEVPIIQRVDGRTTYFKDGSSVSNLGCIIMCTDYRHHHPYMAEHLRDRCVNNPFVTPCIYKSVFWVSQPRLAYLGMQKQVYGFLMLDIQAALVRDVFLGYAKLPFDEDEKARQADVKAWQARESKMCPGDTKAAFDFQTAFLIDILDCCDPKTARVFDPDRILGHCHKIVADKEENIMTYRDQRYKSLSHPFKEASATRIPWVKNMNDSIDGLFANIADEH